MACIIRDLQGQVANLRNEVSTLRDGFETYRKAIDAIHMKIDSPEKWQRLLCDYRFKVFPKATLQASATNHQVYNAFMVTCEKFVAAHPGCIGISVDNSGYLPAGNYRVQPAFIFSDGPWTVIPEFRSGKFTAILETDVNESDNAIHMLFASLCGMFPKMKVKKDDERNTYTMFFNRDGGKDTKPKKAKNAKAKAKKTKKDMTKQVMPNNQPNEFSATSGLPEVEQVDHDHLGVEVE